MKCSVLYLTLAVSLVAQAPQPAQSSAEAQAVVARVNGHDLTQTDLEGILQSWPADMIRVLQQDPVDGLRRIYTLKFLAAEGEKRKLAEEEPLKSQLATQRALVMAQAEITFERNTFPVSEEDIKKILSGSQIPLPGGEDQRD